MVEHAAAICPRDALGVAEVEDGVVAAAELDALVLGRQKTAPPRRGVERLRAASFREENDEGGEVLVLRAQAVGEPRADRRTSALLRARLHKHHRRLVVDGLGVGGADDAELVDDLGRVREETAHPRPAPPVLLEINERAHERERRLVRDHAGVALRAPHRVGDLLSVPPRQRRLVVEELELRRPAALEQVDHPLRSRRVVRRREHALLVIGEARSRPQQPGQGHRPQPQRRAPQEVAAGVGVLVLSAVVHGLGPVTIDECRLGASRKRFSILFADHASSIHDPPGAIHPSPLPILTASPPRPSS